MANIVLDGSEQFLFRGITHTKNGSKLREKSTRGISYTTIREAVLQKLEAIGLDKRQYGLHSLRAGGASAAANAGVPDRMFKRHGRWRSENAKDGYVRDSLSSRLQVSESRPCPKVIFSSVFLCYLHCHVTQLNIDESLTWGVQGIGKCVPMHALALYERCVFYRLSKAN